MTLSAASPTQVDLAMGQVWTIKVQASELPSLTIILPDGSTLTPAIEFSAEYAYPDPTYVATVPAQAAGRHIALVQQPLDPAQSALIFQAWANEILPNAGLPTAADLDAYLGTGQHSWPTEDLQEALDAEAAAQRRVCRVPAAYPPDLREALLRRAARNLEMRRQMTEQPRTDGDFGLPNTVPPGRDQEIRRYEAPWRKLTLG